MREDPPLLASYWFGITMAEFSCSASLEELWLLEKCQHHTQSIRGGVKWVTVPSQKDFWKNLKILDLLHHLDEPRNHMYAHVPQSIWLLTNKRDQSQNVFHLPLVRVKGTSLLCSHQDSCRSVVSVVLVASGVAMPLKCYRRGCGADLPDPPLQRPRS